METTRLEEITKDKNLGKGTVKTFSNDKEFDKVINNHFGGKKVTYLKETESFPIERQSFSHVSRLYLNKDKRLLALFALQDKYNREITHNDRDIESNASFTMLSKDCVIFDGVIRVYEDDSTYFDMIYRTTLVKKYLHEVSFNAFSVQSVTAKGVGYMELGLDYKFKLPKEVNLLDDDGAVVGNYEVGREVQRSILSIEVYPVIKMFIIIVDNDGGFEEVIETYDEAIFVKTRKVW